MATKQFPKNTLPGEGNCPYANSNCCKNFHGNPDNAPENFKRCQTFIMKYGNKVNGKLNSNKDNRTFNNEIH